MKKIVSLMLSSVLAFSLVGCGNQKDSISENSQNIVNEIALVTDVGTIDDRSFNQGSWEGVKRYAEETEIGHVYFQPVEKSTEAIIASIELAIKGGAKVIVCPGFLFEVAVYQMQEKYPDVKFILLDGVPRKSESETQSFIAENTTSIFYKEEQAGFLAGYAAIKDGYRNIGFMGGIAVPAVVRYGYGFVQGADYAAQELGLQKDDVKVKYTYVGNFEASPDNLAKASSWYNEGVEVIFGCGGGVGNSVMKAAEAFSDKKVIGVDVDQSSESETVITSAMKNLQGSVYENLKDVYTNNFKGGQEITLGAETNSILLPMETSKFNTFSNEDYQAIYGKIVNNEVKIGDDTIAEDASKIDTKVASVTVQ